MTLEEIVSQYEDLWRTAALEDQLQLVGYSAAPSKRPNASYIKPGKGRYGRCAWLNPNSRELVDWAGMRMPWACFCGWKASTLSSAMVHLNNEHEWTWDMFANKFRDALQQGGVKI